MADLKQNTTIGGSTIWTQGNLNLQSSGNSIAYRGFKVYTENDKPTPDDVGALATTGGTLTGPVSGKDLSLSGELNVGYRFNMVRAGAGFSPYMVMARSDNPDATIPSSEITVADIHVRNTSTTNNPLDGGQLSRIQTTRLASGGAKLNLYAYGEGNAINARMMINGFDGTIAVDRGNFIISNKLNAGDTSLRTLVVAGTSQSTGLKVTGGAAIDGAINVGGAATFRDKLDVSGAFGAGGTITANLGFVSNDANMLRGVFGPTGFLIRSDGGSTYFLHTAANDQWGTWNNNRPLVINNSTGKVDMNTPVTMSAGLNIIGTEWINTGAPLMVNNVIKLNTKTGAWLDMRTQPAYEGQGAVTNNGASALARQEHANYHFILGGLGNGQFGLYKIDKSRTANGTDASLVLDSSGNVSATGSMTCGGITSAGDIISRATVRTNGIANSATLYMQSDSRRHIQFTNAAGTDTDGYIYKDWDNGGNMVFLNRSGSATLTTGGDFWVNGVFRGRSITATDNLVIDSQNNGPHISYRRNGNQLAYIQYLDEGKLLFSNNGRVFWMTSNGQLYSSGEIFADGAGNFQDVYIRSDIRDKKNIQPVLNPLDTVDQLNGVSYLIKHPDGEYRPSGGLIAQQVRDVLPHLVTEDAESGRLRVNYNGVIGVLVESIKALREEIDTLKGGR